MQLVKVFVFSFVHCFNVLQILGRVKVAQLQLQKLPGIQMSDLFFVAGPLRREVECAALLVSAPLDLVVESAPLHLGAATPRARAAILGQPGHDPLQTAQ
jgi:hypothetical protein